MTLERLKQYLRRLAPEGIALAFSGGVDSSLLLKVLSELRQEKYFQTVALTMHTVLQSAEEVNEAEDLAEKCGIEQQILSFNPFALEAVSHNRADRCYHCKKAIFEQFLRCAAEQGLKYVIDGTNADDLQVYRPGRKALNELGILSPLAELGIGKAEIRRMSAELGLKTALKPAVPCLATRFEYDTAIDEAKIRRVEAGEKLLKNLLPNTVNLRLRVHGILARVEVEPACFSAVISKFAEISKELKALGFGYVTLDLEGFRSGSWDIGLQNGDWK